MILLGVGPISGEAKFTVPIDPGNLPKDAETLRKIVLDLMAQLEREFSERHKYENLLRELLDAQRNRKSEQLSKEQLALFEAACRTRFLADGGRTLIPSAYLTPGTLDPRVAAALVEFRFSTD